VRAIDERHAVEEEKPICHDGRWWRRGGGLSMGE
jgi:hypothetical protein